MTHPIVQAYKYDSLDRVIEAEEKSNGQQNWIQEFGYDRYGNRTSFNQLIGQTQQNQTLSVDPNTNRFWTGQGYVYDLNGNLIEDAEGRQFTFNGDNKQTEVRDDQNNIIGEYFYDGEGKRVKKITPSTGETTIFVYSGGKLIAEYSTILAQNPTISYATTDQLGSPRVITDAFGQVISRRDFMPYGEELQAGIGGRNENQKYSVTGTDNVRKRFTGYEKDAETGLHFAEARYYNNAHGRFTAVDPLLASGQSANPQTFNRYIYTTNNPLNFVDPSGLLPQNAGADGGCDFQCRVTRAINGQGQLSEADKELAKFHIRNGSALGYAFLNASYAALNRQTTQTRVVAQTVTMTFSIDARMLTVNRTTRTATRTYGWVRYRGHDVWGETSETHAMTTETFQIGGSSGNGEECLNNADCAVDEEKYADIGPIPIGSYVLDKNRIEMLDEGTKSYLRAAGKGIRDLTGISLAYPDYGSFRVPLTPTTPFRQRSGFYLHGGSYVGSRGCIDVGGGREGNDQTKKLLELIRSSSFAKITLTVTR
jgi:RHS repeat-associated protein